MKKIAYLLTVLSVLVLFSPGALKAQTSGEMLSSYDIGLYWQQSALQQAHVRAKDLVLQVPGQTLPLSLGVDQVQIRNSTAVHPGTLWATLEQAKWQDSQRLPLFFSTFPVITLQGVGMGTLQDTQDSKENFLLVCDAGGYPLAAITQDFAQPLIVRSATGEPVSVAASEQALSKAPAYDGSLLLKNTPWGIEVINRVDSEQYLMGVVPKEVVSSWPAEVLKAQAICSRNFALRNHLKHKKDGFMLCATTHCQVYGGSTAQTKATNQAVTDTHSMLAYYQKEPAELFFHASSGGYTKNPSKMWAKDYPYLQAKADPYSLQDAYSAWEYRLKIADLERYVPAAGKIYSLQVEQDPVSGRINRLWIKGEKKEVALEEEKIRQTLGYNQVKSTLFSLSVSGYHPQGEVVFTGRGYGHGVGMSQSGAKKMAQQGLSYQDILKFYFSDIEIR